MWDPVRVGDGFIGIQAPDCSGVACDSGLVRSSDLREWAPIPNDLPSVFLPIAAMGDVIYAVGPMGTPIMVSEVYSSNDGGTSWVNVPVETPTITCSSSDVQTECWSPPGSEVWALTGVAAGEGGVVIATHDMASEVNGPDDIIAGPLFVLRDGVFERVDAPFTGNGDVLVDAVGDSFYAHSRTQNVAWVSDDGRSWTQVTAPNYLQVLAVVDDTIHAVSYPDGIDRDLISTDRGRTWTPTPERPPLDGDAWNAMIANDHTLLIGSTWTDEGCPGVLWMSADGQQWERVLDIWPGTCTRPANIDEYTIVVNPGDGNTWFGAIV
jgi:hypothetical protein